MGERTSKQIVYIDLTSSKKKWKKKKMTLIFDVGKEQLYMEITPLHTTIFCALFDGTPMIFEEDKVFVNADWIINESGDKQLAEAAKKRKEIEFSKLEYYREKYGFK